MKMMNRLGVLVAVSIAAYAIKELTSKRSWTSFLLSTNSSEHGEDTERNGLNEEEEKANSINVAISQLVNGRTSDFEGGDHSSAELRPPESENLSLDDNNKKEKDKVAENQMENNKIELERLVKLVRKLERKLKLEGELVMCEGIKYGKTDVTELRKQVEAKNDDICMLNITISTLQAERKKLQEEIGNGALMKKELEEARSKIKELQRQIQLDANQTKEHLLLLKQRVSTLVAKEEEAVKKEAKHYKRVKAANDFEVELGELKRKNRELGHENQELIYKLDAMKAKITTLTNKTELCKIITKEREEAQKLRSENEDLINQREGLQMNRFSEVEELVYLRWINACLRYELRDNETSAGESARYLNKILSLKAKEKEKKLMLEYSGLEFGQATKTDHESNDFSHPFSSEIEDFDNTSIGTSKSRTSSFSENTNSKSSLKKLSRNNGSSSTVSSRRLIGSSNRWKDPLEAVVALNDSKDTISNPTSSGDEVYRDLEFARRKLARHEVNADMETRGALVMPLAMEVRKVSFTNMEDVVTFVIWLDEKLSSMDDGMEVLEHFDWPEGKVYALREAAFGYEKLMEVGEEVFSFVDNPKLTSEIALKKMHSLLDKVEQSVYAVLGTREMAISRYEELGIPIDWLLDSGVVAKIKVSCVELARKYMKRIVNDHNALSGPEEEQNREFFLFQGVRFASRVHKFSGGFDSEGMKAFEELRSHVHPEARQKQ